MPRRRPLKNTGKNGFVIEALSAESAGIQASAAYEVAVLGSTIFIRKSADSGGLLRATPQQIGVGVMRGETVRGRALAHGGRPSETPGNLVITIPEADILTAGWARPLRVDLVSS